MRCDLCARREPGHDHTTYIGRFTGTRLLAEVEQRWKRLTTEEEPFGSFGSSGIVTSRLLRALAEEGVVDGAAFGDLRIPASVPAGSPELRLLWFHHSRGAVVLAALVLLSNGWAELGNEQVGGRGRVRRALRVTEAGKAFLACQMLVGWRTSLPAP